MRRRPGSCSIQRQDECGSALPREVWISVGGVSWQESLELYLDKEISASMASSVGSCNSSLKEIYRWMEIGSRFEVLWAMLELLSTTGVACQDGLSGPPGQPIRRD